MKKLLNIVFKVVFSRTMISIILLAIQALMLFGCMKWLRDYLEYAVGLMLLLGLAVLIIIINRDEMPEFKLVWVIPVCIFPVFGALLYLFIMGNFGGIGLKKELDRHINETDRFMHTNKKVSETLSQSDIHMQNLSSYIEREGRFPTYNNSSAVYFPTGEEKFANMLEDLKSAKKFIFLEYFIVERGFMWNSILDILKMKAKEGVEVRVMYDGMCSLVLLPPTYPRKLRAWGIKAKMFSPIIPLLSTSHNNRDHRKILVVDGQVAYTGGVNLADEYINKVEKFGHWKDVAVKVTGDAVTSFTMMFLQMWNVGVRKKEDYGNYIKIENPKPVNTSGFIIPYGDGPTTPENVAETIYMDMINSANKYVYIMTPYFVVDNAMLDALQFAGRRGVKVKVIVPHVPDKKTVFSVTRSYYPDLLAADIEVYEYTPGFVHGKVFVSDDEKAIVGTINMDYRSLYHHFECAAYLYKSDAVKSIVEDFEQTLGKCQLVTKEHYLKSSAAFRLMGRVLRLFGPLM